MNPELSYGASAQATEEIAGVAGECEDGAREPASEAAEILMCALDDDAPPGVLEECRNLLSIAILNEHGGDPAEADWEQYDGILKEATERIDSARMEEHRKHGNGRAAGWGRKARKKVRIGEDGRHIRD